MNFLAHLFLAENNKESIIGNFIADHVKGNAINTYKQEIIDAIRFHRSVDEYTDNHPTVKTAVENLRPQYRKYSGVVLDMYYDHFLALYWDQYSMEPLEQFTARIFKILTESYNLLPPRSQFILPYMMSENWLLNYRELDGLHKALSGIANRTKFRSDLFTAAKHLRMNYQYYSNSFNEYFPQLIDAKQYGNLHQPLI